MIEVKVTKLVFDKTEVIRALQEYAMLTKAHKPNVFGMTKKTVELELGIKKLKPSDWLKLCTELGATIHLNDCLYFDDILKLPNL